MSEFHAKAQQATVSQELAKSPYVAARAGFELTTIRTKGDESTNEPPLSTICTEELQITDPLLAICMRVALIVELHYS